MNTVSSTQNNQTTYSYTIAKGIDGILWIWEKIQDNCWKVYPYDKPHVFHFEDNLGNRLENVPISQIL